VVKFNFQGGKNQFPRFDCPPNKFTANANQSNDSVTVSTTVKFNFQVVKINFPGPAARQTRFTANANQSNESVTAVKINFNHGKIQFPRW